MRDRGRETGPKSAHSTLAKRSTPSTVAPLRAPFTALAARSNVSGYLCSVFEATILRLWEGGAEDEETHKRK